MFCCRDARFVPPSSLLYYFKLYLLRDAAHRSLSLPLTERTDVHVQHSERASPRRAHKHAHCCGYTYTSSAAWERERARRSAGAYIMCCSTTQRSRHKHSTIYTRAVRTRRGNEDGEAVEALGRLSTEIPHCWTHLHIIFTRPHRSSRVRLRRCKADAALSAALAGSKLPAATLVRVCFPAVLPALYNQQQQSRARSAAGLGCRACGGPGTARRQKETVPYRPRVF